MKALSTIPLFSGAAGALCMILAAGCGSSSVNTGASSPTQVTIKHGGGEGGAVGGTAKTADTGAAGTPAASGGGVGTFKGKVVFQGNPPKLEPLYAKGAPIKEALCVKETSIPNEKLVVGEGNGVANVFIFLPKAPSGAAVPKAPDAPVIFDQKNCRFLPHALFVRVGQTLKVLNSDVITHNTHVKPNRNPDVNLPINPNNKTGLDLKYKLPEAKPFEVKCDIHSWMMAHHLTLDHPWAAISGPNGEFEIKDIPAGTYKFQVWHESATGGGYLDRNLSVTIKPGEVTTKEIPFDASKLEL